MVCQKLAHVGARIDAVTSTCMKSDVNGGVLLQRESVSSHAMLDAVEALRWVMRMRDPAGQY